MPIDPGWTLAEVVKMLRLTKRYVLALAQQHAEQLSPAVYRPLGASCRMYRVWSSHDVQTLNRLVLRRRVKTEQSVRFLHLNTADVIRKIPPVRSGRGHRLPT